MKKEFVPRGRREVEPQHLINGKIRFPQVRVVGDGIEASVMSSQEAQKIAEDQGKDLVLIAPNAVPPVCKVIDYKKFLYEQKKKQKELKAKTAKVVVKEVRFSPNTDDHDFNFKVKHAQNFLNDGAKVKSFVFFKGRSIVFKEQGEVMLLRFAQALEDFGIVEQLPKLEGKRMLMIITPKKKK